MPTSSSISHGPRAQLLLGRGQVGAQRVQQLLADPQHRVERVHRALEDDGDLPPAQRTQLRRRRAEHVEVAARDAPAVVGDAAAGDHRRRAQQPDRAVGERRLATAALAGEADDAPGVQRQVDAAHGAGVPVGRAVGDRQVADVEQRARRDVAQRAVADTGSTGAGARVIVASPPRASPAWDRKGATPAARSAPPVRRRAGAGCPARRARS